MGVDTKMILLGAPSPEEIAAIIRQAYQTEAVVNATSVEDMFNIRFPDPDKKQKNGRQLTVFPDYDGPDDSDVFDGKRTLCSFGAWGSSVEIANVIASRFGGYVLDNDYDGEWRFVEPTTEDALQISPVDKLKVDLSRILGPQAAVAFSHLVDDRDKLERVMEAYEEYAEATRSAAPTH